MAEASENERRRTKPVHASSKSGEPETPAEPSAPDQLSVHESDSSGTAPASSEASVGTSEAPESAQKPMTFEGVVLRNDHQAAPLLRRLGSLALGVQRKRRAHGIDAS